MAIKPSSTLSARFNVLRSGSSDFADELDEITDKISTIFPEHPSEQHLYIFVVVPVSACEWTMSLVHVDNAHVTTTFDASFSLSPIVYDLHH
jgi:hypothetical protein